MSHGIDRAGEPSVSEGKMKSSREVSVVRDVVYLIGLELRPVKGEVCVIKCL